MPELYARHFAHPEELPQLFVDAWNQKDASALAALFAEDAEFVNVVGLWWHDRAAIWKAHEYGLRVIFPDSTLHLRQKKVKMLGEKVAVVHARMKLTGQSPHGEVRHPADRFNIFTFVVQHEAPGWLCVAAHNNDQVPGQETHVRGTDGQLKTADYRE